MSQSFLSSSVRSIPTALTIFRLLSAPVLMVLAYMGRERFFLWLAIAALLSDVLDGALDPFIRSFLLGQTREDGSGGGA